ncbi:BrxE family protein [Algoriphagus limi]|uniref:BrxE family protein n=1 Tax=Algoriphagus limi TaxID=2975273 RepID=A0ABT2G334_9BACT|nr:BrxE family protein [Algoriphagus limi]MCS5488901.1 BrxE family protein [Algoriphagus limi]
MKEALLNKILELRTTVGFLMEETNWWNTQFFESTSNDFLGYIFPKSINQKKDFYLDLIRYLVDIEVGANYYHLFRLPVQVEEKLYKMSDSQEKVQPITYDKAILCLKSLSEDLSIEPHQGPINIGSSEAISSDIIQVLAAHYLSAFENDYKVHPYLN